MSLSQDVVSTSDSGATAPISAGFFRIEKGRPCVFRYEFDEAKHFIEGQCVVQDETGARVTARGLRRGLAMSCSLPKGLQSPFRRTGTPLRSSVIKGQSYDLFRFRCVLGGAVAGALHGVMTDTPYWDTEEGLVP